MCLSDLHVMVDHCPPPGRQMLAIVEGALAREAAYRGRLLIEPEIRPWVYLPKISDSSPFYCDPCTFFASVFFQRAQVWEVARNRAYPVSDLQMSISPPASISIQLEMFWLSQCAQCRRIYWAATPEQHLRWMANLAKIKAQDDMNIASLNQEINNLEKIAPLTATQLSMMAKSPNYFPQNFDPHAPAPFNPHEPIGQKPALNPSAHHQTIRDWARFNAPRQAPSREPTFAL